MTSLPTDGPRPDDLQAKFREDADLHAHVRDRGPGSFGQPQGAKWERVAERLDRDEARP